MEDTRVFWLAVMNIALGLAVLLLVLGVVTGVLCDFVAKIRKRHAAWREIDKEMHHLFPDSGPAGRRRP